MLKKIERVDGQSCWNKADEDEMVFVLLGRDVAAPAAIEVWCLERIRLGKNRVGDDQIKEARKCGENEGQPMIRYGQIWESPTHGRFQVVGVEPIVLAKVGRCRLDAATGHEYETPLPAHRSQFGSMLKLVHDAKWTRTEIESMQYWDRPMVRCCWDDEDREGMGSLTPDGALVWVSVHKLAPVKIGWCEVLKVLNHQSARSLIVGRRPRPRKRQPTGWEGWRSFVPWAVNATGHVDG